MMTLFAVLHRVCVVGKRFEGKTEHKERWYGTEYSYRKIAPETISQWEAVDGAEQLHLHLPAVNEFIPTDFELAPLPDGAPKIPVLVQVCTCNHRVTVSSTCVLHDWITFRTLR